MWATRALHMHTDSKKTSSRVRARVLGAGAALDRQDSQLIVISFFSFVKVVAYYYMHVHIIHIRYSGFLFSDVRQQHLSLPFSALTGGRSLNQNFP